MFARLRSIFTQAKERDLERQRAVVLEAFRRPAPTQGVAAYRSLAKRATINGLLAKVDEDARARCESRLAEVLRLRGSA